MITWMFFLTMPRIPRLGGRGGRDDDHTLEADPIMVTTMRLCRSVIPPAFRSAPHVAEKYRMAWS